MSLNFNIKDQVMFNENSKEQFDQASALNLKLVELSSIKPSSMNFYSVDDESVKALSENIHQNGILQPITCDQTSDGKYTVIGGHRRLKALEMLVEAGEQYSYCGLDITGKVPVMLVERVTGTERMQQIIAHNNHRDLDDKEKREMVDYCEENINKAKELGKNPIPEGVRMAHYIASQTGLKEGYVKNYLASKHKAEAITAGTDEDEDGNGKGTTQDTSAKDDTKKVKKLTKMVSALVNAIDDMDYQTIRQQDQKTIALLNQELIRLKNMMDVANDWNLSSILAESLLKDK